MNTFEVKKIRILNMRVAECIRFSIQCILHETNNSLKLIETVSLQK